MQQRFTCLFIVLISLVFVSCKQQQYEVIGYTPTDLTAEGKKVYLTNNQYGVLDSTIVHQGSFKLSGKLPPGETSLYASIRISPLYLLPIILEPGYTIQAPMHEFAASGSPLNNDLKAFLLDLDSVEAHYLEALRGKNIIGTQINANGVIHLDDIDALYLAMRKGKIALSKKILEQHPNDVVGVQALLVILNEMGEQDIKSFNRITGELGSVIRNNKQVEYMAKLFNNGVRTNEGNPYTNFQGALANGEPAYFSDFIEMGKYTLVDFSADWCEPCRIQTQELIKLNEKYANYPINFVTVCVEASNDKRIYCNPNIVPWKTIIDNNYDAINSYKVKTIPEVIIIDPNGYIVARNLRGENLKAKLNELLCNTPKTQVN